MNIMKKQFFVLLAFVAASSLQAATIHVPGDHSTIQGAVDASSSGDTIVIASGTYGLNDPVSINSKAITLQAEDGPGTVILNGDGNNTLLVIQNVSGNGVTINGLSFIDGQATQTFHGGCAVVQNSVGRFVNTHFGGCETDVSDSSNSGGAIKISNGSNVSVEASTFVNNRSYSQGGAVHFLESAGQVLNSTFQGNIVSGLPESGGGGVKSTQSVGTPILVQGNIFENNEASFAGGAISAFASDMHILNNIIRNNGNGRFGGGIHLESLLTAGGDREFRVIENLIEDNFITNVAIPGINPAFDKVSGGGMHINFGVAGNTTASVVEIIGNIIRNNTATDSRCTDGLSSSECSYGGGIIFFNAREALQVVRDNEFIGNTADVYAGVLFDKVWLNFSENTVENNQARFTHPGMGCVSNNETNAVDCAIYRNLFSGNGYTAGTGTGLANDSGALNVRFNNVALTNNLFINNFGNLATVFVKHEDTASGFSTIDHNTFVDNAHENAGFGVVRMQGEAAIRNNIFLGGNRALRVDDFTSSASSEIIGNNITGMTTNVARVEGQNLASVTALNEQAYASVNTDLNPQFVDPGGGDYRLDDGSLLIELVDCIAGVTVDFDGTQRPQGDGCDVGAFEWFDDPTIFADRFES